MTRWQAGEIDQRPWPDLESAQEHIRSLRGYGWRVREWIPPIVRPDGVRVVAQVCHPVTGGAAGDVLVAAEPGG